MKKLLLSLTLLCASLAYGQRDPKMDAFIDDLMSKMTLDEKLGQLNLASGGVPGVVGAAVGQDEAIRKGYLSATGGMDPAATQKAQEIAVKESRLGIPLLIGLDVIHGYKTVFPIPLAISCSWNPELIRKSARIAAEEASAFGINWFYSPMVDIARDARWGRRFRRRSVVGVGNSQGDGKRIPGRRPVGAEHRDGLRQALRAVRRIGSRTGL